MKFFVFICLICLFVSADAAPEWYLSSCARMNDGVIGSKAADILCMVSCNTKNCGESKCVNSKTEGRPVCTCARCGNGAGTYPIRK